MARAPLVSVIVRTKNRRSLLPEAINSLLEQSHPALEILVVNDGGEDVSDLLPTLSGYPAKTLRHIDLHPSRGRAGAANAGLAEARGQYIGFLDDDDWLDTTHVARLAAELDDHPDCPAAYSAARVVTDDAGADETFAHPFDPVRLLLENYIPIHAVLFRRRAWEQGCAFDPAFDVLEDWDFWLQLARLGEFRFIEQCTANYRLSSGSGSGAKEAGGTAMHLPVYKKWLPRLADDELLAVLERARQYPRLAHLLAENEELKSVLGQRDERVRTLELEARERQARHRREIQDLNARLAGLQSRCDAQREELDLIYSSRSWRLTRPLRYVSTARMVYRTEGALALGKRAWHKFFVPRRQMPALGSESKIRRHFHPLVFDDSVEPTVSIIIPVHDNHQYTFHCLAALNNQQENVSYEIIVVDDCSGDETAKMLGMMSGITVITNRVNLGFIRSCNAGAGQARGEYLVFLNNDTEPHEGWLSALLATFGDFPEAGLVGARLVYPDGTLQEAGGIVWRDGSAWNYGRGDDPNRPEYAYLREADYCSGACLMIPARHFQELGMFDDAYAPAYYEDTDLAFKVRRAGRRVYYQPVATVVHFEGISSGTDPDKGAKQYQAVNQQRFAERWREVLAGHRHSGEFPNLEKERQVKKRLLVIDARVLMPDNDSGSLRMYRLLEIFRELGYKVTFIADNLEYHPHYTPRLQAVGVECVYRPYVATMAGHLEVAGHLYDLVLLSRADTAEAHMPAVRRYCPRASILFDTVDLHFLREQRQGELTGDQSMREAALIRKQQETSLARQADMTLVVSPVERDLFAREMPDIPVAVLTNIHRSDPTEKPFAERRDILFIGSFEHPPNVDAVLYFLDEILPLIHERHPEMRARIVGGHLPRRLKNRADSHVTFTGFVSDIRPLFNDIRLSIAPLRYGAGVKGKINSSMAFGVPVVATTPAAEGMGLEHDRDILIADTARDFANQVLRAHEDGELWQQLRKAGLANIEQYFSYQRVRGQVQAILQRLPAAGSRECDQAAAREAAEN